MMHASSVRGALANVFQIPFRPAIRSANVASAPVISVRDSTTARASTISKSSFSTSATKYARSRGGGKPDRRITLIRFFLHHPTTLTPRPLRFSRNRHLRHWTITRAWNLYRHNVKYGRQMELERQYNAMRDANEELRVGAGDGGRLFRKAQMKNGVWGVGGSHVGGGSGAKGRGGVPIEYARGLVEWVGSTGGLGVGAQTREGESAEGGVPAGGVGKEAKIWDSTWKRY